MMEEGVGYSSIQLFGLIMPTVLTFLENIQFILTILTVIPFVLLVFYGE